MHLRCVVSAAIQIKSVLLCEIIPLFAQFAGDQRVRAEGRQLGHRAVAAAAAKGHSGRSGRAVFDRHHPGIKALQGCAQRGALARVARGPAHRFAAGRSEKRGVGRQAELAGQQRVVAQVGMAV